MKYITDESRISRKNVYVIGFAIFVFLLLTSSSVYKWIGLGDFQPTEIFFEFLIAFVLYERAKAKFIIEMQAKQLKITKVGLLGPQTFEIAYKNIAGIYIYKPKLLGPIKFKKTWRLHSALDGREVWTLAYQIPNKKGKMDNYRIYLKCSNELLQALHEKMPNRVMIPEDQAAVDMILNEDGTSKENQVLSDSKKKH